MSKDSSASWGASREFRGWMLTQDTSERLKYELLRVDHAWLLEEVLLDPRVYTFIDGPPPANVEELIADFTNRVRGPRGGGDERWWNFAVRVKEGVGEYIGRIEATEHDGIAEVGYTFGANYWRQGFGTESVRWLEARMIGEGFRGQFWGAVEPGNERSVRLLARLGYREVESGWPELWSYVEGDRVFVKGAGEMVSRL